MENQKKSQEEVLKERIEKLEQENEQLKKDKAMFEEWWRKADAKVFELAEATKSIGTIANIVYNSAKA